MIWTGLSFTVLARHDGRFLHLPGLFGFARREPDGSSLLLFAGQADDPAQATGPGHPQWEAAARLGLDELHVHFPVPRRVDRLQLLSRVVRHVQPLLNVLEEAHGCLATTGHFCGRGLRKRTALREALDRLAEDGGPLQRARGCLYTVRPLDGSPATEREAWEGAEAA